MICMHEPHRLAEKSKMGSLCDAWSADYRSLLRLGHHPFLLWIGLNPSPVAETYTYAIPAPRSATLRPCNRGPLNTLHLHNHTCRRHHAGRARYHGQGHQGCRGHPRRRSTPIVAAAPPACRRHSTARRQATTGTACEDFTCSVAIPTGCWRGTTGAGRAPRWGGARRPRGAPGAAAGGGSAAHRRGRRQQRRIVGARRRWSWRHEPVVLAGNSRWHVSLTSPDLAEGVDAKFTCASNNGQLGGGAHPDGPRLPAGTQVVVHHLRSIRPSATPIPVVGTSLERHHQTPVQFSAGNEELAVRDFASAKQTARSCLKITRTSTRSPFTRFRAPRSTSRAWSVANALRQGDHAARNGGVARTRRPQGAAALARSASVRLFVRRGLVAPRSPVSPYEPRREPPVALGVPHSSVRPLQDH